MSMTARVTRRNVLRRPSPPGPFRSVPCPTSPTQAPTHPPVPTQPSPARPTQPPTRPGPARPGPVQSSVTRATALVLGIRICADVTRRPAFQGFCYRTRGHYVHESYISGLAVSPRQSRGTIGSNPSFGAANGCRAVRSGNGGKHRICWNVG